MTSGGFNDPKAPLREINDHVNMRIEFCDDGQVFVRNRKNAYTPLVNRMELVDSVGEDPFTLPSYAKWSSESGRLIDFDEPLEIEV